MNRGTAVPCLRQRGNILVMFTIGLFALIAMVALALDGSDMLLSKGRLQNAADAAALHAAKALQDGATLAEAREAAVVMLAQNLGYGENQALEANIALASPDIYNTQVTANVAVEFSALPDPFIPVLTEGSEYVRVRVEDVSLTNYLAQVMNFNKRVRASAVAGRSTDLLCNNKLVPMLVCTDQDTDTNPNDDFIYGIQKNAIFAMKTASPSAGQNSEVGPGNFQLLALDGTGGDVVRDALAGKYTPGSCVGAGDTVPTETGNKIGPVADGLNTRFGEYQGGGLSAIDFPRDINICQGARVEVDKDGKIIVPAEGFYSHTQYLQDTLTNNKTCVNDAPPAVAGRRELQVVIGRCDGSGTGKTDITVKAIGCFFLIQDVSHSGDDGYVIGQFIEECASTGSASLDPNYVSNTSTIVLYRDPDSPDS